MSHTVFQIRVYAIGFVILMILFINSYTVSANGEKPTINNELSVTKTEDSESESLKNTLSALSSSASESGLNGDYLPGMVTVLYGKDLADRGVISVGEALTHVPGIAVTIDSYGTRRIVVRGMPKPFASGQIKFLLNGEPMNTVLGVDLIPNIPIEQIRRIEMVRGPSSVRYGESAYSGVVNIVTRKAENIVYSGAGKYDSYLAGAVFSKSCPEKDFSFSLNMAYQSTQRGDLAPREQYSSSVDNFGDNYSGVHNDGSSGVTISTDGVIIESLSDRLLNRSVNTKSLLSTLFSMEYKSFNLEAHHLENGQGNFYSTVQEGLNLNKKIRFSNDAVSTVSIGWTGQSTHEDYSEYHNTITNPIYAALYTSTTYQGNADLTLTSISDHSLFFDVFFKNSESIELERKTNSGPVKDYWPGIRLISLMLQDTWKATDRLSITGSARSDWYESLGNELSQRLAAVYRLNPSRSGPITHLLKIQAARAIRLQSFLDITDISTPNLTMKTPGFETVDSIEGGYIFRSPGTTGRITAFTSKTKTGTSVYINDGKDHRYTSYGTEAELEQDIYRDILKLDLNGSWVRIKDQDSYETPQGAAGYLANAGLVSQFHPRLSMTAQYQFIGNREGGQIHSADITAVCKPIHNNFTIRGGVKNLFNSNVMYPSHLDQNRLMPNGHVFYPGSYQKAERWWWMRMEYAF